MGGDLHRKPDVKLAAERKDPIRQVPAGRPALAGLVLVDVVVGEAQALLELLLGDAQRLAPRP
jgi:hypothetical protein